MRSRKKSERERVEQMDNFALQASQPISRSFKSSCGGFGLIIRHKNKADLIKAVMEKEKRGWERAMNIKEESGFYVVKLVFNQKPMKEQV
ncbi:hypothetical protein [Shouchella lehensis]|uniref:Uncharacterized protein n=1 Tax=Shouchella lehensis G1 TaxID=1246626 RepID=A0A060M4C8_9BACI|nr:hypothetical protein [Shouchella lehensis]AIC95403.1 hypothetical protein BleG1_2839 [Shouchella lehensis G1]